MKCIDEEAANIILKLIGHDGNILSICDDCKFNIINDKDIPPNL